MPRWRSAQTRRLKAPAGSRPHFEELEPRVLYSADLAPTGLPGWAPSAEVRQLDTRLSDSADNAYASQQQQDVRLEIVFVDTRIDDYQRLLDNLTQQPDANRELHVVLLDAEQDGIDAISRSLAEQPRDVAAVHLISHGDPGHLQLGASSLDLNNVEARQEQLRSWALSLGRDADLLIYGCDVAASPDGQALIERLAQLTGADVAASDDKTGNAEAGGDWLLEYRSGTVETTLAVSTYGIAGWRSVLATYTVTNTNDSGAGSLRQAILNSNATATVDDTIVFNIAGTGTHTITLVSALPSITDTVIIDATTDDSFAANGNAPAIAIDENEVAPTATLYLDSTAGGSTIRGLAIWNFTGAAIFLSDGADGNTVAGNYIGMVGFDGEYRANAGNNSGAVRVESANNIIGGSVAADRNVIANQNSYGVVIYSDFSTATGNQIIGNYFGVNASGTANIPSIGDGVADATGGNTIANNWIASVGYGIWITPSAVNGDTVTGNRIGTDLTGTLDWGTVTGIYINGGDNHRIGGTGVGEGNIIAFSNRSNASMDGVQVASATSTGNAILGNLIYGTRLGTSGRGIDLGTSGTIANDAGDGDAGANNLQNFPVLTTAVSNGTSTITISGSLNSTASSYYRIEFFASPTAHASGYGEGQIYLGFANVATDGSGNATFSTPLSATVPAGYGITGWGHQIEHHLQQLH